MDIIKLLPKVDLHIHLDGSVRPATIREIAEAEGIPLPVPDMDGLRSHLQVREDCRDLPDYLSKFDLPVRCMQSVSSLERIAFEIVEDAAKHNVRYMEVRFAPLLHTQKGLPVELIIKSVLSGMEAAEQAYGIKARVIVVCLRSHSPKMNENMLHGARPFLGKGVVGIDLAGDEVHYPPELHRDIFRLAHSFGFPVTIHAGEAAGPESIRESVVNMHASRIGHGVRLKEDEELLRMIVDKGITLEMCPTSNIQTKAVESADKHPMKEYYDRGVRVTLNTDNTTVSGTDMTEEIRRAMEWFHFSVTDIAVLMRNAVQAAFLEEAEKRRLWNEFQTVYKRLEINV